VAGWASVLDFVVAKDQLKWTGIFYSRIYMNVMTICLAAFNGALTKEKELKKLNYAWLPEIDFSLIYLKFFQEMEQNMASSWKPVTASLSSNWFEMFVIFYYYHNFCWLPEHFPYSSVFFSRWWFTTRDKSSHFVVNY